MNDLENTVEMMRKKKAILLYLSQNVRPNNFIRLSEEMKSKDPTKCGFIIYEDFQSCLMKANMSATDKELEFVVEELTTDTEPRIPYLYFLDAVYLTRMFINEMELYQALKAADKDNQNGVTITEMKEILKSNETFQFPDEALGAAFKAMLGADIDSIEPNCIIDTEKFIESLHKQFEEIS